MVARPRNDLGTLVIIDRSRERWMSSPAYPVHSHHAKAVATVAKLLHLGTSGKLFCFSMKHTLPSDGLYYPNAAHGHVILGWVKVPEDVQKASLLH